VQHSLGILNTAQRGIFGAGLTFNMMLAAYYTQLGLLTTGDIIMIQSLMLQFLSPLFFLGSMYRSFNENLIDINKINRIVNTPASVEEGTQEVTELQGKIEFKDVAFSYLKDLNYVFERVSFTIQPGSFVAIVGRSGSGKTSILNLIFRLYDPQTGSIELDGKDIKDLTFSFRNHISFVSQNPYLFNGTVM
jgi:ABC-type multidrug transport system fused ATPase/permease subunit